MPTTQNFFVINPDGCRFNVRLVEPGHGYGVDDKVVHDDPEPMIEFYDATHAGEGCGARGQFVSRYDLSTLLEHDFGSGLDLDGGVPEWWLSALNVQQAQAFAKFSLAGLLH